MQQTENYDLNLMELSDPLRIESREALNENFGIIDEALKEASENGGIAVQDTQPTTGVLAWIDSNAQGADFCMVGDTAPATDGTVAVWVDTSEDEIPVQSGAGGVSYDNTQSGLTANNVQGAIDEITADFIVDEGTEGMWTYRKWNSGIAECWGRATETNKAMTQLEGYGYFASGNSYNYPTGLFTATPVLNVTSQCGSRLTSFGLSTHNNAGFSGYYWCTTSITATIYGWFRAIGTWK